MLNASHAIIGASIAKLFPNPYLGLPLSLASHFLGDFSPHWDLNTRHHQQRTKLQIISLSLSDAFIGYALGYLLFSPHVSFWYLFLMMFTAQLPDWLEAPYHILNWHFPPFSAIKQLQSKIHTKLDWPWGLLTQVVIVVAFAAFALL
jgi:hypothetical protein